MENHEKNQGMIDGSPDGFVAVDIGALSRQTEHQTENSSSRSILQRNGGDTTEADVTRGDEKEVTLVHVAQLGGPSEVFRVTTPRAGGKCKRSARRRSTWLHPRKVLFVFAALSSMGTLILLYFTLSMAKSTSNQIDDQ
ncbi:transmembrane protein [Rhynchospora pubera]|uniref:Transmembrane protein n=1 Tax=Rhynchospora pubera TaxID=906938 RepID=A0AAV8DLE9_9POAL|nr:transmembrane protein [Rhynchospora pubera]